MTKTTATTTGATYMRDAVPAEKMGQCPCCLKNHRSTARGTMIRHGWKESGRQVGQHGCGFQWGNCHGFGMRPLEQTDADAQTILTKLAEEITSTRAAIVVHTTGEDSYPHSFEIQTYYERTPEARKAKADRFIAAFTARGLKFTTQATTVRVESIRVVYRDAQAFRMTVARGAKKVEVLNGEIAEEGNLSLSRDSLACAIPSYEALRKSAVEHLTQMVKSMERQREAIKAAIKHHAANPSNGQMDTKRRGNLTHYTMTVVRSESSCAPGTTLEQRTSQRIACGKRSNTMRGRINVVRTDDRSKVTCAKCLKNMPKEETK